MKCEATGCVCDYPYQIDHCLNVKHLWVPLRFALLYFSEDLYSSWPGPDYPQSIQGAFLGPAGTCGVRLSPGGVSNLALQQEGRERQIAAVPIPPASGG